MITRRNLLGGLAGILASGVAPAIAHQPMRIWTAKAPYAIEWHHGGILRNEAWDLGVFGERPRPLEAFPLFESQAAFDRFQQETLRKIAAGLAVPYMHIVGSYVEG